MGISTYSTTPGSNNLAPPNGAPEGMPPNAVNDVIRQMMADIRSFYENPQWIDYGSAGLADYDGTSFNVTNDQTAIYKAGRRVKIIDGSTTLYGVIASAIYSPPNTRVTVTLDSGTLDGNLSSVSLGPDFLGMAYSALSIAFPPGSVPASALAGIAAGTLLANTTNAAAPPLSHPLSDVLDLFSNAQGAILYRGLNGWAALAPGVVGQFLMALGAGHDPAWGTISIPPSPIKAWVDFSIGSGGAITINSSMNVATVTRQNAGQYTVIFATPLNDALYFPVGSVKTGVVNSNGIVAFNGIGNPSINSCQIVTTVSNTGNQSSDYVSVGVAFIGN